MEDNSTPGELLDWLCWVWATDGERFYPATRIADESFEGAEIPEDLESGTWEEGYHSRAYIEAVDRYEDLILRGFDPVMRAERYIKKARSRGEDLPDIDWEWWEAARKEKGLNDS